MDFKKTHGGVPHKLSFDPSGIDICGNGHVNIDVEAKTIAIDMDTIAISGTTVDISAPLCIHTELPKLDRLGWDGKLDLKFDNFLGSGGGTVDNANGWYLVRQTNKSPDIQDIYWKDQFHFGISHGTLDVTKTDGVSEEGSWFSRKVSDYDYDEILFYNFTSPIWQIFDRTVVEGFVQNYDSASANPLVKKSSVSASPHLGLIHARSSTHQNGDVGILYSDINGDPPTTGPGGQIWVGSNGTNPDLGTGINSYYVRRSDGEDVRLKNKVKVDASGNLNVDGIINCSRISAIDDRLNMELDRLEWNGNLNLTYDDMAAPGAKQGKTVDNAGNWYLVRQQGVSQEGDINVRDQAPWKTDHFKFANSIGSPNSDFTDSPIIDPKIPDDWAYSRNISSYDYDEVLLYDNTKQFWQIWDRSAIESLMSWNLSGSVPGIKRSSVYNGPHSCWVDTRDDPNNPHIFYSNADGTNYESHGWQQRVYPPWETQKSAFVRRSDGQPVRLKNKGKLAIDGVLVPVDGNLEVDGDLHIHNSGPESIIKVSDNGLPSLGVKIISKNLNSTNGAGSIEFVEGVDSTGAIDHGFAMGYNGGGANHLYNWPVNTFNIARFDDNTDCSSVISIRRETGHVGIGTTNPTCMLDIVNTDDNEVAELKIRGINQGTGKLFIGQSDAYGGGMIYNGDGVPDSWASTDKTSFYRRNLYTDTEVFSYGVNNNNVTFEGAIDATTVIATGATINGLLTATSATINGLLTASSATITGHLIASSATINGHLIASSATINGNLSSPWINYCGQIYVGGANGHIDTNSSTGALFLNYFRSTDIHIGSGGGNTYVKGFLDVTKYVIIHGEKTLGDSYSKYHASGSYAGSSNKAGLDVESNIWAEKYISSSDMRIKDNIRDIDATYVLDLVNKIECKEYNYMDPMMKVKQNTFGFIAQQVKEHFPNAVMDGFKKIIPSENRLLDDISWNVIDSSCAMLTIRNYNYIPDDLNDTGKFKFHVWNDASGIDEEMFEIFIEDDGNSFKFEKQWEYVYFYGKEVTDFHTLDKNQIFALHHSAIQELSRRNDAKTAKNVELQTKITSMEADMAIVKEKLGL
jgi:hypothetical protein